jgi:WD40 repeat protein
MARIFVSHSSLDNAISAEIMVWLRANGFDQTFLDIDKHAGIQPGTNWERTLYQQIDSAHAVILVLTPHWLESKWCFAEFTQARALGKSIFPVIVAPGGERFVAPDIQQLDLRADRQGGLAQLARELTQIALDAQGGFPWDQRRPPYPGLLSFQTEDAAIYFGRDDDVRRLIERLNARRVQGPPKLVALLGASGSGKSSLVRAGVLPRLQRDKRNWIVLPPFRPRNDPLGEFARAAAEALGKPDEWRAWRDRLALGDPGKALADLTEALQTAAGSREAWLLLTIDQAEELFTVTPPAEAETFLRVVKAAADEASMFIGLITLRSDYLEQLQVAAEGVVRFEEFSLGPMPLNRVRQIIEGPARVAGLKVEEGLIAAAVTDAGTEDALPLLAFTLRELYDRYVDERESGGPARQLSLVQYAALGDPAGGLNPLENSVRKRADEVLSEANPSPEDLQALREAFIGGLVWINDEGEYSRRPARIETIPDKARPILQKLEAARLVIFGEEAGQRTVEVAHESLLRKWPRLRGWLDEERDFLLGRMQLDHAMADWQKAAEADKRSALIRGLLLGRARQWLVDHPRSLSDAEKAFIAASVAEEEAEKRRGRRLRNLLIAGAAAVVAVVIVAGGIVFVAQQNAETARREAEAADRGADATLLAFESRDLLQRGDLAGATAAAVDAVSLLSTTETRSALLQSVLALSPHLVRSAVAEDMRPGLVAFVPDTTNVLVGGANGRLHLWDPAEGAPPAPFAILAQLESAGPQPPAIRALAPTRVGGAAVLLDDGRLFRLDASGAIAGEVRLADDIGRAAAMAPGGATIVAASQTAREISAWRCEGGDCAKTVLAEDFARTAAVSADGGTAAVATEGAGLIRVELGGASPATASVTLTGDVRLQSLALTADGAVLAAGSVDGRVFLVDAAGAVREVAQPQGSVTALAFSPDGGRLAAACGGVDICVYVLGADGPALDDRLSGHANTVVGIAWNEAGDALASASVDGSVKYWTVTAVDPTAFALDAPPGAALTDLALSPDGRWLAAGGGDGGIFVFDLPAKTLAGAMPSTREAEIRSLRWNPERPWIAAVDADGFLAVRDWPEGEVVEERRIDESVVESVRWLPDGKALAVATLGGAVRLWPLGGEPVDFDGLHPEPVLALAVLPGGERLVSADALGNVWLWDIAARKRIENGWTKADAAVDTIVIDNAGTRLLVTGNGGILYIYDIANPGAPQRIDLGSRQIDGAAWSPDGSLIAAVDTEGNLKVWSLAEGKLMVTARIYRTGPPGADPAEEDEGGHLRRMLWVPDSTSVAIATSAGEVVVVAIDEAAWLARARAVFGIAAPVEQSAAGGDALAETE